jgi:hypothetical protein
MMPNHIAILSSLLVGLAATLGTIVIHGFAVHTIIVALRRNLQRGVLGARIWVHMTFTISATLIALAGHLMEIALWAFALDICGAVPTIFWHARVGRRFVSLSDAQVSRGWRQC